GPRRLRTLIRAPEPRHLQTLIRAPGARHLRTLAHTSGPRRLRALAHAPGARRPRALTRTPDPRDDEGLVAVGNGVLVRPLPVRGVLVRSLRPRHAAGVDARQGRGRRLMGGDVRLRGDTGRAAPRSRGLLSDVRHARRLCHNRSPCSMTLPHVTGFFHVMALQPDIAESPSGKP